MISSEQLTKINSKFPWSNCISVFQLGDDSVKWNLIVKIQNSMGQFECLSYLNKLSGVLGGKSHALATIEDRMLALYEFSIA